LIDHWANYQSRFIRNNNYQLPNEVWVVDKYALEIARDTFSNVDIKLINSHYLEQQVAEIDSYSVTKPKESEAILFLMEPVRDSWNTTNEPPEIESFRYFLSYLNLLTKLDGVRITIKPHPSDADGKYDYLLAENKQYCIEISSTDSLSSLLASSNIVVGCQTYAMVVALAADKKVICALPSYAPECILPHSEIIKLSSLVKLNSYSG
jgi:hypothetical protein